MTTETKTIVRPYAGDTDLQTICDLLNYCSQVYTLEDTYSAESLRDEFDHPDLNKALDLQLWEDEAGRLVGFGQLWPNPRPAEVMDGYLFFRVHPEAENGDVVHQIIEWASTRMRSLGQNQGLPVHFDTGCRDEYAPMRAAVEQNDFKPIRYFFMMGRPLDEPIPEPQFPEGFVLRYVASDEDLEQWVEAFNLSFIDHWNHHPFTIEARRHWMTSKNYVAERDLIGVAPDGTVAGFCWCRIDPDENERNGRSEGWIEDLGTRRGYRKIGLGKALLLAGLQRLKADGVDTALLGVDAENPSGALGLYESVGFTKRRTNIAYRKEL